ncbi:response regulator [Longimicrobium terrae]|uniref:Two-component system KDP operon response regulator KdpE n=1 Tax=Longimicrobium terrae TaxID=1639882 RepID=A0A841H1U6_9BACT|nr:response regulator transcription factor [Longimicrobium terrae]MBB4637551.1 two-component system KDP operon response regulator KdpE [Longimicrobium terrae]MBB6071948.1 two-component system KDP operon response regulator KdpE [Longimicrobium terrae]NNC30494.1 response regulator transcription factor [Longimicrobium terrae]
MSESTILVIDDEPQIRLVVRRALADASVRVIEAATGAEGIALAAAERPDLIVLDLGLPDIPGVRVCAEVRKWSAAPIVVLSARHSEHEKVSLLDAGADDYVTKPFGPAELQARVRAQLRRSRGITRPGGTGPVEIEGLSLDLARRVLSRDGEEIHLTPTEWDLLRAFAAHAGSTLTHQQLFSAVWGRSGGDPQAYLRVHVANLRRKIEADPIRPRLIITEPGVGYRFRALD